MTVGEIMKTGEDIGKEYVDEIAHKMVLTMIEKRKEQIQRRLLDESYKDSHKRMKITLATLTTLMETRQPEAAYNALFNETRNNLIANFRRAAEITNTNLTNAEYFHFTGRLR